MNNSLYTLCQECAFQYLFLPLALSGRALQFLEYEQFGGKQLKAKVFSLYSKKRIYLVEFSCLKYTDLNVVGVYKQHEVRSPRHSGNTGTLGIPAVQHQLLILLALCGQISQRFQALTGDKQLIATERSQERHWMGKCCCFPGR